LVHPLPPNLSTFRDAVEALLRMAVCDSGDSERFDIVFDVYRKLSIKGGENSYHCNTTTFNQGTKCNNVIHCCHAPIIKFSSSSSLLLSGSWIYIANDLTANRYFSPAILCVKS